MRIAIMMCLLFALPFAMTSEAAAESKLNFETVESIFAEHCLDCHAAKDPEHGLVLETWEGVKSGGESGLAVAPGKSSDSLLIRYVEGKVEKDGKIKIMPPGKRKKLSAEEILKLRRWIDGGALGPSAAAVQRAGEELSVPHIVPTSAPRRPIEALAYAPGSDLLAAGRYQEVELFSGADRTLIRRLGGAKGQVNAVVFDPSGRLVFGGSGEPGRKGEVKVWNSADGRVVRTMTGHADAIYSLAVSPDGRFLASGSYDQKIKIWDAGTGQELRTLTGHNGAVFGLAFRPDGKILASASADRTVKLWEMATGERKETLSEPLKELYAVVFSPDGKRLYAGGVDNRIRVWAISATAAETTNPLLETTFAHEGAILNLVLSRDGQTLVSSADDRTVKVWDAVQMKEKRSLEAQPDWAHALAVMDGTGNLAVGRMDGTLEFYSLSTGQKAPVSKPELASVEPRGIERGVASIVKVLGKHLRGAREIRSSDGRLRGEIIEAEATAGSGEGESLWVELTAAPELPLGRYEFWVAGGAGESGKLALYVDDLPQRWISGASNKTVEVDALPVSVWGLFAEKGAPISVMFHAKAGEQLVFDLREKSLGSKAAATLTLLDDSGRELARSNGFDGVGEPLFQFEAPADGRYRAEVQEFNLGASPDHYFRLSIGEFPVVTDCFPLGISAHEESEVELVGYQIPADRRKVRVRAGAPGELSVPVGDFRARRELKVQVSALKEVVEKEPNDDVRHAMPLAIPGVVDGRFARRSVGGGRAENASGSDVDLYKIEVRAGEPWIIETEAAQRGSPADTKVEVLDAMGQPVERVLLQAVRDSSVTFRGIDSNTADCRVENWREMDLNELLYFQGEVVKIFRMPQGPDSGFLFYNSSGKRRTYFDTSATAHALDELCYVVKPFPPGTKPAANGLPAFPVYFGNDDDGERKRGTDSVVHFTAPAHGSYLVKVSDTRGFSGERLAYRLVVRRAAPDFVLHLNGRDPKVNAGSGRNFSVTAERLDGFDGEIQVEISDLPPGFVVSNPLVIQEGHDRAEGTLCALLDAPKPAGTNASASRLMGRALIDGKWVTKTVENFGRIELVDPPKAWIALQPESQGGGDPFLERREQGRSGAAAKPVEISMAPGATIPVWLKVKRNGYDDLMTFTIENLPHGVIVDNIGLNGVLIPKGEVERQIFLTAEKWVPEMERACFAIENQAGRQTSFPVLLKVAKERRVAGK